MNRIAAAIAAWWSTARWLRTLVQVVALLLLGAAALAPAPTNIVLGVPGILLEVVALILNETRVGVTERLEEDLAEATSALDESRKLQDLALTQWLGTLVQRSGLGDDERVTLYVYTGDERLVKSARWAFRADWRTEGRDSYPVVEGLLSTVWAEDYVYVEECPSMDHDYPNYMRFHLETGLSEAAIGDLDMPARCYLGWRLQTETRTVGVLMFESTKVGVLSQLDRDRVQLGRELHALAIVADEQIPEIAPNADELLKGDG